MPKRRRRRGLPRSWRKANTFIRKELRWRRIKYRTFEEACALWRMRYYDRKPGFQDVLWFITKTIWTPERAAEHAKRSERRRRWQYHNDLQGWGSRIVSGDYLRSFRSFTVKRRK